MKNSLAIKPLRKTSPNLVSGQAPTLTCGSLRLCQRRLKAQSTSKCSGQAMLIAVLFFVAISMTIILGLAIPVLGQLKVSQNLLMSKQSLFLAEAGMDDVAYRIKNGQNFSNLETLVINGHTAETTVEEMPSGYLLTTEGNFQSVFRKVTVRLVLSEGTNFQYGVQVGDGGLVMGNNAEVHGNVFSNGDINAANNARIFGSVAVAEPSIIDGGRVWGDIHAVDCLGVNFVNDDEFQTLYTSLPYNGNCSGYDNLAQVDYFDIEPQDLPISDEEIEDWQNVALAMGGVCGEDDGCDAGGNYIQGGGTTESLGPIKIEGDLILGNNAVLELTGTLWVTGNIVIGNNAEVFLSSDVYGPGDGPDDPPDSGMIIANGEILLDNNSISTGSGIEESYIMYVSTAVSPEAIEVRPGDTEATIVYANHGTIIINNEVDLLEVVAYGVHLNNEAVITYEIGLAHTVFTSGPGGSFVIINWREIE